MPGRSRTPPAVLPPRRGGRARTAIGHAIPTLLIALGFPGSPIPTPAAPNAVVTFSDGRTIEGALVLPADYTFPLLTSAGPRPLSADRLAELRFTPERESLERRWRFPDPGIPVKEYWGDPYPVRTLRAIAVLRDGTSVAGDMNATALRLRTTNGVERIVIRSKQRGTDNQSLDALVYVSQIALRHPGAAPSFSAPCVVALPASNACPRAAALALPGLLPRAAEVDCAGGILSIARERGDILVAALRYPDGIRVGWPGEFDADLDARLTNALADVRDFFDRRVLLGSWGEAASGNVFSLLLLTREGATTLGGPRNRPWCLAVWRWVPHPDDPDRFLLAARGILVREMAGPRDPLPAVRVDSGLRPGEH